MHTLPSRRIVSLLAAGILSFIFLLIFWHRAGYDGLYILHPHTTRPRCQDLSGAEDVLMIMKTGATEIQDKLSVHLRTTLTCYPHYLIFSDYEERLPGGEHVLDALKYVSSSIQDSHEDFELWRRLRINKGRAGLLPSELSGTDSSFKDEPIRMQIPGWKLDKWKFLPMLNQTLHHHPKKRWYVFVEADTYILWSSLLPYLSAMPWTETESYYLGSRTGHEDVIFAHGGSGFALSRFALEKVVALFANSQQRWEAFTDRYVAGDHILGAAMREAGIYLRSSSPSWQGEPIGDFDLQGAWCETAITYHHESPEKIVDMWKFEQEWIAETDVLSRTSLHHPQDPRSLRHRDVFQRFIMPRMQQAQSDWDNLSSASEDSGPTSVNECEAMCEKEPACLQYAFRSGKQCTTSKTPLLGKSTEGVQSGWMPGRLQQYFDDMGSC